MFNILFCFTCLLRTSWEKWLLKVFPCCMSWKLEECYDSAEFSSIKHLKIILRLFVLLDLHFVPLQIIIFLFNCIIFLYFSLVGHNDHGIACVLTCYCYSQSISWLTRESILASIESLLQLLSVIMLMLMINWDSEDPN